ncbi:MAG: LysM peptidoglycan-binding domain-containing protein [Anaerovoracaceae bacterium]|jgi:LysM repeat protein
MNDFPQTDHWVYPNGHILPNRYECKSVHTVESGDTLYSLSQRYKVPVPILMQANRVFNPYSLKIGQKICIPEPMSQSHRCEGINHVIVEGDTLYMIAKRHNVTLDALIASNPEVDPYNLQIGETLCIPTGPISPVPVPQPVFSPKMP